MKRREAMEIHLQRIISGCDSSDFYRLIFELQHTYLLSGYALAMLFEFDNIALSGREDNEIFEIMKSNKYTCLFDDWINEEL